METIPVFKPSITEEEVQAVREVLLSGWLGLGPKTKEFEERFAQFLGVKYAVAMNSCTAALHLAIKVLGIGPGDEVITPSLTFVSTNHAILFEGATPVFADIDPDTLTIDPDDVAQKITPRTRLIICMHYGGHPCDMDELLTVARSRRILILEDAAHACGAKYKGRPAGTLGDIACFSFHAVKNLTTGEGGMVVTNDEEKAERLRKLRWCGINKDTWKRSEVGKHYSWYYEVEELGYKYHMNDIAAAIGLVQLRRLEDLNRKRRQIVSIYNAAFRDLDWLRTPVEKSYVESAHHNYVIKTSFRDPLITHLQNCGVSASVHYIPNHYYEMYRDYCADVPVTEFVWKKLVTLPLYPDMTNADIDTVVNAVTSFRPNQ